MQSGEQSRALGRSQEPRLRVSHDKQDNDLKSGSSAGYNVHKESPFFKVVSIGNWPFTIMLRRKKLKALQVNFRFS